MKLGGGNTNSPELSLLKFLPLTYHHSHFLAATFDFTSFFTLASLEAVFYLELPLKSSLSIVSSKLDNIQFIKIYCKLWMPYQFTKILWGSCLTSHPGDMHGYKGSLVHWHNLDLVKGCPAPCMKVNTGPSGIDAAGWRRMCTSFQSASADLCDSLASVARRMASTYVNPHGLSPLLACRLIALDKNPGVRLIGIGETSRRIISKAILFMVKTDILEAAGNLQLCAGQEAGCEAAVHAMQSLFHSSNTQAVLLADASNAFNSLNRHVSLHNLHFICPPLAVTLTNVYREASSLFIDGECLLSEEGTTQGDPLAMAMYMRSLLFLLYESWMAWPPKYDLQMMLLLPGLLLTCWSGGNSCLVWVLVMVITWMLPSPGWSLKKITMTLPALYLLVLPCALQLKVVPTWELLLIPLNLNPSFFRKGYVNGGMTLFSFPILPPVSHMLHIPLWFTACHLVGPF